MVFDLEIINSMNDKQQLALFSALNNKSMIFLGTAGTGKSHVIDHLTDLSNPETTFVTGATGMIADARNGITFHSFVGVGVPEFKNSNDPNENNKLLIESIFKVKKSSSALKNWKTCKRLIIEEFSELSGEFIDLADQIGRNIRSCQDKPFGGIQVIFVGDLKQLCPVKPQYLVIESKVFKEIKDELVIELTEIFRQKEPELKDFLNNIREGNITPEVNRMAASLTRPLEIDPESGIKPTKLYSTKMDVLNENLRELEKLPGIKNTYMRFSTGTEKDKISFEKTCPAPEKLELKVGAQVIYLRNDPERGLVNGSKGIVTGFHPKNRNLPFVKFYKTVKLSNKKNNSDNSNDFISPNLNTKKRKEMDQSLLKNIKQDLLNKSIFSKKNQIPTDLQDFEALKYNDSFLIEPVEFVKEDRHKKILAKIIQLPLNLAWALTIHKSQGMTLDLVEAHLDNAFAYGQVFTCLSRAKSIKGLRIFGWDPQRITNHPLIVEWYKKLEEEHKLSHYQEKMKNLLVEQKQIYMEKLKTIENLNHPNRFSNQLISPSSNLNNPCAPFRDSVEQYIDLTGVNLQKIDEIPNPFMNYSYKNKKQDNREANFGKDMYELKNEKQIKDLQQSLEKKDKQLKKLIAQNKKLEEENHLDLNKLKSYQDNADFGDINDEKIIEELQCIVCKENKKCIVFAPCGHKSYCVCCSFKILSNSKCCSICRQNVKNFLYVYQ